MAYDKVIDSATLDAGMAATANAIREKTGQAGAIPWENDKGFSAAVAGIQVGGGGSGGENLLDYASTLCRTFIQHTFESGTELVVSFGAKATVVDSQFLSYTFYRVHGLKSVKLIYGKTFTSAFPMQNTFQDCYDLEMVDLTGMQPLCLSGDLSRLFYGCNKLREIKGEMNCSETTTISRTFENTIALETVRFTQGTIKWSIHLGGSPNLTDETIQNIIDGLADLSGGTAQTLTLHATVGAKLTDAQKSAASAKNWTISY